jgi:hypothetical protein
MTQDDASDQKARIELAQAQCNPMSMLGWACLYRLDLLPVASRLLLKHWVVRILRPLKLRHHHPSSLLPSIGEIGL